MRTIRVIDKETTNEYRESSTKTNAEYYIHLKKPTTFFNISVQNLVRIRT